jgi:hypothetical protein
MDDDISIGNHLSASNVDSAELSLYPAIGGCLDRHASTRVQ